MNLDRLYQVGRQAESKMATVEISLPMKTQVLPLCMQVAPTNRLAFVRANPIKVKPTFVQRERVAVELPIDIGKAHP